MELPGLIKTMAPGMSQVIEAGMVYVIKDDNGVEAEFIGKLDQQTIDFLRAFDVWVALHNKIGPTADVTRGAFATMIMHWNGLGKHAKEAIE